MLEPDECSLASFCSKIQRGTGKRATECESVENLSFQPIKVAPTLEGSRTRKSFCFHTASSSTLDMTSLRLVRYVRVRIPRENRVQFVFSAKSVPIVCLSCVPSRTRQQIGTSGCRGDLGVQQQKYTTRNHYCLYWGNVL